MELAHALVPFGALDERWNAARERRVDDHLGDVAEQQRDGVTYGQVAEIGNHLFVEGLERVGDQRQLVGPVAVDR